MEEHNTGRLFIVSWNMLGLESLIDVTQEEREQLFDIIATGKNSFISWLNSTVSMMLIRARLNTHRNYEIYSFWVDESITKEELTEIFEESPQTIVDMIRARGTCIYGSKEKSQNRVIF